MKLHTAHDIQTFSDEVALQSIYVKLLATAWNPEDAPGRAYLELSYEPSDYVKERFRDLHYFVYQTNSQANWWAISTDPDPNS